MTEVNLLSFELEDIPRLEEIAELNKSYMGRSKNWRKFVEWNIENRDVDLYWKITLDDYMVGFIGFSDATNKLVIQDKALLGDLFLEIYLDPNFTRMGIGKESYNKAILKIGRTDRFRVFASTYLFNTKAQKFFQTKLGMKRIEYNKKYNTVLFGRYHN